MALEEEKDGVEKDSSDSRRDVHGHDKVQGDLFSRCQHHVLELPTSRTVELHKLFNTSLSIPQPAVLVTLSISQPAVLVSAMDDGLK